jgi:predicted helicase
LSQEYLAGIPIVEIMPVNSIGFQSHRDSLVLDFDERVLMERIRRFADPSIPDAVIEQEMGLHTTGTWNLKEARHNTATDLGRRHVHRCLYRPYDARVVYYHDAVVERRLFAVLGHLTRPNIALTTMRQTKAPEWRHALVADAPVPAVYVEIKDGTSVFPLYLYSDIAGRELFGSRNTRRGTERSPNLSDSWTCLLARLLDLTFVEHGQGTLTKGGNFGPDDVLHYVYAQLHSPRFRQRYAELLKREFPRIFPTARLSRSAEVFSQH